MIYCVIGTRAQMVKMGPVINQIEARGWPLRLIHTGQHQESMDDLQRDFGITSSWAHLYTGPEVKSTGRALKWLLAMAWVVLKGCPQIFDKASVGNDIVLVHGDTFSTVLGALLAKRTGIQAAHIESGLRSFNFLHPFPEEINRCITFKLVDLAFCPGQWAYKNLKKQTHLKRIDTHHNTIVDALSMATNSALVDASYLIPNGRYGIISIHRFENIFRRETFEEILRQLIEVSQICPLIFVLHPATRKKLSETGLMAKLEALPQIELRERTGYFNFVRLLSKSYFVITDGGSNQEELTYLGIPTFLMRKATERQEGLDRNVVIGSYSSNALSQFMTDVDELKHEPLPVSESPTEIILDHLRPFSV